MNYKDLALVPKETEYIDVEGFAGVKVKNYIPMNEKIGLVEFVLAKVIDERTGCASPFRTEIYTSIALCMWYADIEFDEGIDFIEVYNNLESNNFFSAVFAAIPDEEYRWVTSTVEETINDVVRYNNSAAGIIQAMSGDAGDLNTQLSEVLAKVQDKEGFEQLSIIKDMA